MSSTLKKLIIALGIVVVISVVYILMQSGNESDMAETTSAEIMSKTEKILADTQKIDKYKLETSIFNDVRFTSLEDFSVTIIDVKTGRVNPFEPVR